MDLKILKAALAITGVVYLLSFVMLFLPWATIEKLLLQFAPRKLLADPFFKYIVRILCGGAVLVGIFFIKLARDPQLYPDMMVFVINGLFFMGIVMLVSGFMQGFSTLWYLADPAFCFLMASIILLAWKRVQTRNTASKESV